MEESYLFFAGVDWATEKHDVAVISDARALLCEFQVGNSADGLNTLAEKLSAACGGRLEALAVAIETPRGPVVETLVERGFHVFSINPKQLDRFRDRHAPAGSKDDKLDAFVLADSLRTDMPCFRRIQLCDQSTLLLRELSRVDADLGETKNRLTNQLREQLMRFHPDMLKLCTSADEPWFWALIEATGDASAAVSFNARKAKKLLTDHGIRRWKTEDLLQIVRAERVTVAPGTTTAAMLHARVAITQLRVVAEERQKIRKQIDNLLSALADSPPERDEHRDAAILCSLPGVGKIVAATVLAEASQAISERDYAAFRAHAGVAPITKRSGKRRTVLMRQACNERLRNAIYHWSRVSVQRDVISRQKYSALRARGHSHGRALRSVADSLLRILFGMLRHRTLFNEAQRAAAA